MFEDITEKFKKFKMPEESLLKKIERIKKTPDTGVSSSSSSQPAAGSPSPGAPPNAPDPAETLKKNQEEMTQKIEEILKSKTEQITTSIEAIKEYDIKINKLEGAVSTTKNSVGEFKDRLDKIDESLLELLSLYEVVSSTVNPFVGDKNVPNEKLDQLEKRVEDLTQRPPPELPPNVKEEYDIKFKALEGSLEELTQIVSSPPLANEELIKNVSEKVMENIRPLIDQIKPMIEQQFAQTAQQSALPITPGGVEPQNSQYIDEDIKLRNLDNKAETSIIILNWIEFLLEKVGRNNLSEVLEYYIDIGWISEEVCEKMLAYSNGIDYYVERPTWKLLPDDHTRSLMFIEQLKGKKLDKLMLSKLERDVEKVIRTNEIYVS